MKQSFRKKFYWVISIILGTLLSIICSIGIAIIHTYITNISLKVVGIGSVFIFFYLVIVKIFMLEE